MLCKRCNSNNFERDVNTGNSYCNDCGTLQEYDNYEAQLGGIKGPIGNFVRVGTTGTGSVLAYKDKKIFEATNLIELITERLNMSNCLDTVKSMISEITDGEFGKGEWFSILIGACCYATIRKEGKGVLSIEEVADVVECDLHQLGNMIKRVVEHLGLELKEFDLVGLFNKTVSNSSRFSEIDRVKKEMITKQGSFLMNCSLKWFLSTGRKPMPLVVAVLAFVFEMNGVKVKIDELAKDVRVSLVTCKLRYKELLEKLVEVSQEMSLPWAKDITVKNVVKHSKTLIGLMEAKSMRKRRKKKEISDDGVCLKEIVRDCLSKEAMYYDVGNESQLQLSLCNTDDKIEDGVCNGTLVKTSHGDNMWEKRLAFDMVSCEDWWKGKSKLSQKLSLKEVLEKDIGLDALPVSYIKGRDAIERRREKIKSAKLRINSIKNPSDVVVSESSMVSLEVEHSSKKRRKIRSELDWEDLVIQTLVLHNVKDEEIEKGHYKNLLGLYVFNSGVV